MAQPAQGRGILRTFGQLRQAGKIRKDSAINPTQPDRAGYREQAQGRGFKATHKDKNKSRERFIYFDRHTATGKA